MLKPTKHISHWKKNDNEPSRFGVAQAVGGVSVQAHAKQPF